MSEEDDRSLVDGAISFGKSPIDCYRWKMDEEGKPLTLMGDGGRSPMGDSDGRK